MMNIMRADLYRIFRGIGIYAAIIMIVVMASVSVVMREPGYVGIASDVTYDGEEIQDINDMSAEDIAALRTERNEEEKKAFVREVLASNVNLYYPLIIIVFVLLMSDFSNHTIKNTLTSAISKKKYYMFKWLQVLLFAGLFIIISNLFVYVLNFLVNGREYTENIINTLKVTLLQMPMLLGAVSLLTMLGFLLKRAASFNAVAIPLIMLFQIIMMVVYKLTKSKLLEKFMSSYELQAALGKLAFFPEKKFVLICTCIGFLEILLTSVLGYLVFKKSEIA